MYNMVLERVIVSPESWNAFAASFWGGALGGLFAIGIVVALILSAAIYIYVAWSWYTIARKLKHKTPWLAWIPFANIALMLQLGRFHWAWVFLTLIPLLGWIALYVLIIIATWRIFERRHYPGWFSISLALPKVGPILYLVALGFVAWKGKR